jgi:dTDP-4-amino-4,6-dideoxygalactose transaminase
VKRTPAILGGPRAFAEEIPINRPTLPAAARVEERLREIFASGIVTNGREVERLEAEAREMLGAADAVAVSNCTAGLMLVWRVLGVRGPVALPSFTFPATAHALTWNGIEPRFVDCERSTFTMSPAALSAARADGVSAACPVYIFGNSPDWPALEGVAGGIPLVSDAAHALGTEAWGRKAGGFGAAEVFSLAPTKVVTGCEGGIVATSDPALGAELRVARNYGNPGDYDCRWVGLNARMSELHAAVSRMSLAAVEENITRRETLARIYRQGLSGLPGIGFQTIPPGVRTNWNYFALLVEPEESGLSSAELKSALSADGVATRRYFHPAVHTQKPYRDDPASPSLPDTEWVCDRALCVPMSSHLQPAVAERICDAIRLVLENAEAIRRLAPA